MPLRSLPRQPASPFSQFGVFFAMLAGIIILALMLVALAIKP